MVATELVGQEVGAVALGFPRLPHGLIGAHQRAAGIARRSIVEVLNVPEAASPGASASLIRRVVVSAQIAALQAVTLRRNILVIEEETTADVGEHVIEHQAITDQQRVRQ